MNAQQEEPLFATISVGRNSSIIFDKEEKFKVSDIKTDYLNNTIRVNVNCSSSAIMKVKIFGMNGEMATEATHSLQIGNNELLLNEDNLSAGTYMVQFYTSEGSALRRFVKL